MPPTAPDPAEVFDRRLLRIRRERIAAGFGRHDFLVREVAAGLAERLACIRRQFPLALDLGCHRGELSEALAGTGQVGTIISADLAVGMARAAPAPHLVADEELLPFAPASLDLVMSCVSLHWVNDLPGTLAQVRAALKPDGLLLIAMLGGETLPELRQSLLAAEAAVSGGASPRVSPFVDLRDLAGLLQRAGFALPVADIDTIGVSYPDALALMRELRGMGETNALLHRVRQPARRDVLLQAAGHYAERFAAQDGRIEATFQVLYATAWSPHPAQQRPLRPGSADASLADALGAART